MKPEYINPNVGDLMLFFCPVVPRNYLIWSKEWSSQFTITF
jgi:hypothetical protein